MSATLASLEVVQLAPEQLGEPIALGRTAEVYALDETRVLKLIYADFPTHEVDLEAQANLALLGVEVAAPRLLAVAVAGNRRGLIFERLHGRVLIDQIDKRPAAMDAFAAQLATLHASIHRVSAPTLPALKPSLARAIGRAQLPKPVREEALARLAHLPECDTLCHMDFHPMQIIAEDDHLFVVDWIDARQGSPAADVARTALLLTSARIDDPALAWFNQGLYRSALAHRYVNHYCAITGMTVAEIEAWFYPLAAARRAETTDDTPALLAFLEAGVNNPNVQPFMGDES